MTQLNGKQISTRFLATLLAIAMVCSLLSGCVQQNVLAIDQEPCAECGMVGGHGDGCTLDTSSIIEGSNTPSNGNSEPPAVSPGTPGTPDAGLPSDGSVGSGASNPSEGQADAPCAECGGIGVHSDGCTLANAPAIPEAEKPCAECGGLGGKHSEGCTLAPEKPLLYTVTFNCTESVFGDGTHTAMVEVAKDATLSLEQLPIPAPVAAPDGSQLVFSHWLVGTDPTEYSNDALIALPVTADLEIRAVLVQKTTTQCTCGAGDQAMIHDAECALLMLPQNVKEFVEKAGGTYQGELPAPEPSPAPAPRGPMMSSRAGAGTLDFPVARGRFYLSPNPTDGNKAGTYKWYNGLTELLAAMNSATTDYRVIFCVDGQVITNDECTKNFESVKGRAKSMVISSSWKDPAGADTLWDRNTATWGPSTRLGSKGAPPDAGRVMVSQTFISLGVPTTFRNIIFGVMPGKSTQDVYLYGNTNKLTMGEGIAMDPTVNVFLYGNYWDGTKTPNGNTFVEVFSGRYLAVCGGFRTAPAGATGDRTVNIYGGDYNSHGYSGTDGSWIMADSVDDASAGMSPTGAVRLLIQPLAGLEYVGPQRIGLGWWSNSAGGTITVDTRKYDGYLDMSQTTIASKFSNATKGVCNGDVRMDIYAPNCDIGAIYGRTPGAYNPNALYNVVIHVHEAGKIGKIVGAEDNNTNDYLRSKATSGDLTLRLGDWNNKTFDIGEIKYFSYVQSQGSQVTANSIYLGKPHPENTSLAKNADGSVCVQQRWEQNSGGSVTMTGGQMVVGSYVNFHDASTLYLSPNSTGATPLERAGMVTSRVDQQSTQPYRVTNVRPSSAAKIYKDANNLQVYELIYGGAHGEVGSMMFPYGWPCVRTEANYMSSVGAGSWNTLNKTSKVYTNVTDQGTLATTYGNAALINTASAANAAGNVVFTVPATATTPVWRISPDPATLVAGSSKDVPGLGDIGSALVSSTNAAKKDTIFKITLLRDRTAVDAPGECLYFSTILKRTDLAKGIILTGWQGDQGFDMKGDGQGNADAGDGQKAKYKNTAPPGTATFTISPVYGSTTYPWRCALPAGLTIRNLILNCNKPDTAFELSNMAGGALQVGPGVEGDTLFNMYGAMGAATASNLRIYNGRYKHVTGAFNCTNTLPAVNMDIYGGTFIDTNKDAFFIAGAEGPDTHISGTCTANLKFTKGYTTNFSSSGHCTLYAGTHLNATVNRHEISFTTAEGMAIADPAIAGIYLSGASNATTGSDAVRDMAGGCTMTVDAPGMAFYGITGGCYAGGGNTVANKGSYVINLNNVKSIHRLNGWGWRGDDSSNTIQATINVNCDVVIGEVLENLSQLNVNKGTFTQMGDDSFCKPRNNAHGAFNTTDVYIAEGAVVDLKGNNAKTANVNVDDISGTGTLRLCADTQVTATQIQAYNGLQVGGAYRPIVAGDRLKLDISNMVDVNGKIAQMPPILYFETATNAIANQYQPVGELAASGYTPQGNAEAVQHGHTARRNNIYLAPNDSNIRVYPAPNGIDRYAAYERIAQALAEIQNSGRAKEYIINIYKQNYTIDTADAAALKAFNKANVEQLTFASVNQNSGDIKGDVLTEDAAGGAGADGTNKVHPVKINNGTAGVPATLLEMPVAAGQFKGAATKGITFESFAFEGAAFGIAARGCNVTMGKPGVTAAGAAGSVRMTGATQLTLDGGCFYAPAPANADSPILTVNTGTYKEITLLNSSGGDSSGNPTLDINGGIIEGYIRGNNGAAAGTVTGTSTVNYNGGTLKTGISNEFSGVCNVNVNAPLETRVIKGYSKLNLHADTKLTAELTKMAAAGDVVIDGGKKLTLSNVNMASTAGSINVTGPGAKIYLAAINKVGDPTDGKVAQPLKVIGGSYLGGANTLEIGVGANGNDGQMGDNLIEFYEANGTAPRPAGAVKDNYTYPGRTLTMRKGLAVNTELHVIELMDGKVWMSSDGGTSRIEYNSMAEALSDMGGTSGAGESTKDYVLGFLKPYDVTAEDEAAMTAKGGAARSLTIGHSSCKDIAVRQAVGASGTWKFDCADVRLEQLNITGVTAAGAIKLSGKDGNEKITLNPGLSTTAGAVGAEGVGTLDVRVPITLHHVTGFTKLDINANTSVDENLYGAATATAANAGTLTIGGGMELKLNGANKTQYTLKISALVTGGANAILKVPKKANVNTVTATLFDRSTAALPMTNPLYIDSYDNTNGNLLLGVNFLDGATKAKSDSMAGNGPTGEFAGDNVLVFTNAAQAEATGTTANQNYTPSGYQNARWKGWKPVNEAVKKIVYVYDPVDGEISVRYTNGATPIYEKFDTIAAAMSYIGAQNNNGSYQVGIVNTGSYTLNNLDVQAITTHSGKAASITFGKFPASAAAGDAADKGDTLVFTGTAAIGTPAFGCNASFGVDGATADKLNLEFTGDQSFSVQTGMILSLSNGLGNVSSGRLSVEGAGTLQAQKPGMVYKDITVSGLIEIVQNTTVAGNMNAPAGKLTIGSATLTLSSPTATLQVNDLEVQNGVLSELIIPKAAKTNPLYVNGTHVGPLGMDATPLKVSVGGTGAANGDALLVYKTPANALSANYYQGSGYQPGMLIRKGVGASTNVGNPNGYNVIEVATGVVTLSEGTNPDVIYGSIKEAMEAIGTKTGNYTMSFLNASYDITEMDIRAIADNGGGAASLTIDGNKSITGGGAAKTTLVFPQIPNGLSGMEIRAATTTFQDIIYDIRAATNGVTALMHQDQSLILGKGFEATDDKLTVMGPQNLAATNVALQVETDIPLHLATLNRLTGVNIFSGSTQITARDVVETISLNVGNASAGGRFKVLENLNPGTTVSVTTLTNASTLILGNGRVNNAGTLVLDGAGNKVEILKTASGTFPLTMTTPIQGTAANRLVLGMHGVAPAINDRLLVYMQKDGFTPAVQTPASAKNFYTPDLGVFQLIVSPAQTNEIVIGILGKPNLQQTLVEHRTDANVYSELDQGNGAAVSKRLTFEIDDLDAGGVSKNMILDMTTAGSAMYIVPTASTPDSTWITSPADSAANVPAGGFPVTITADTAKGAGHWIATATILVDPKLEYHAHLRPLGAGDATSVSSIPLDVHSPEQKDKQYAIENDTVNGGQKISITLKDAQKGGKSGLNMAAWSLGKGVMADKDNTLSQDFVLDNGSNNGVFDITTLSAMDKLNNEATYTFTVPRAKLGDTDATSKIVYVYVKDMLGNTSVISIPMSKYLLDVTIPMHLTVLAVGDGTDSVNNGLIAPRCFIVNNSYQKVEASVLKFEPATNVNPGKTLITVAPKPNYGANEIALYLKPIAGLNWTGKSTSFVGETSVTTLDGTTPLLLGIMDPGSAQYFKDQNATAATNLQRGACFTFGGQFSNKIQDSFAYENSVMHATNQKYLDEIVAAGGAEKASAWKHDSMYKMTYQFKMVTTP